MHRASNPLNDACRGTAARAALRAVRARRAQRRAAAQRDARCASSPSPSRCCVLLACRPGDVVTREEIQAEVWPAGTFVDFEQSLNFCVRQIRAALGDNANAPRYVETLPRRGYRWVGGRGRAGDGPARRCASGRGRSRPSPGRPGRRGAAARPARAAPVPAPAAVARAPGVVAAGGRASSLVAAAFAVRAWLARRAARRRPSRPSFQRITFRRGSVGSARFGPGRAGRLLRPRGTADAGACTSRAPTRATRGRSTIFDASVAAVSPSGEVAFLRERRPGPRPARPAGRRRRS